jgi:hypothetical protein
MPCSSFKQGLITVMLCALYTIRLKAPVQRRHWYHILMKLFCTLALFAISVPAAVKPELKQVNTVYILSMTGGMDQYLANSMTTLGVFQVVADPQKADAIITDRLGEPFEQKLQELYPPPPVVKPEAKDEKDKDKDKDKKDAKSADMGGGGTPHVSSFGRGKGNFFIVDRKSRNVLWSTYAPPKDTTTGELSKIAERVTKRLKNDLSGKKQSSE